MIDFLVRKFVRDYDKVQDVRVRQRYGNLASCIGVLCNLLLFGGKFVVGTLFQSVAITADAVNNLSDAGSSLISLVSFRLSSRPADSGHPFGHARIEYIASMVVGVLVLMLGVELIRSSIDHIAHPPAIEFSWVSVGILAASILVKLWMFSYNRTLGKRIDSMVMQATATDSLSDVLATGAVLLSTIISPAIGFQLDGYMGALVALFIIVSGIRILKDTLNQLLGQMPDQELTNMIATKVLSYDGVLGIHDLMVHNYGPGRCFASAHVEVSSSVDILKSHDVIDNIERDFDMDCGIHLVIHLDPIVTDDERVNALRIKMAQIIRGIDPLLSMHDFRVVLGETHSNLIFDVSVPFECKKTDDEITQAIYSAVSRMEGRCYAVVTIDHAYISETKGKTKMN